MIYDYERETNNKDRKLIAKLVLVVYLIKPADACSLLHLNDTAR